MSADNPHIGDKIEIEDEYYVIKSGVNGKYAWDAVPDVYREVDLRFNSALQNAETYPTFDAAASAVDKYTHPEDQPIIQKVRRTSLYEVIE